MKVKIRGMYTQDSAPEYILVLKTAIAVDQFLYVEQEHKVADRHKSTLQLPLLFAVHEGKP
jgi:hypothetical protein